MKAKLRLSAISLLALVAIAGSCTRETETDRMDMNQNISFIPDWSGETKAELTKAESTISDETISATVLNLDGDIEAYLHATTTSGIDTDSDVFSDTLVTKAAPVTTETMYDSFGVSAFSYTGSWSEDNKPNFFHNLAAVKSGTGYYYDLISSNPWPGKSYNMRFFAYAPKDNAQYVISGATQSGSPTISATIPQDVKDQKCLLVAKTDELKGDNNTAVVLIFDHTLTAIKFVCGDDMQGGTIKSISLKNVYSKGVYNMGNASWSGHSTPATYTQTLNRNISGTSGESVTTDSETFMVLPQTLPTDAQAEVIFTDKTNKDHTFTANLKGQEWRKGTTITYKLSSNPINWTYTLAVPTSIEFSYYGGTNQYQVSSYKKNAVDGSVLPIAWSAQYSEDKGQTWTNKRPEWLTDLTEVGDGKDVTQLCNATAIHLSGNTINSINTDNLRNAQPKGSVGSPYDLSTHDLSGASTPMNTANCYVVNAPGYYSFPLVYGNAIKNNAPNPSAYSTTVSDPPLDKEGRQGQVMKTFLNHAGNGITDPYLSNNGCNPSKAELVWQDAQSLVTNIKYNSGANGGNISFEVNQSSIRQGNAVIAIKDASNTVLWSWHIWVTDENINSSIAVTNHDGAVYDFMPVDLGWCNGDTTIYPSNSCMVKLTTSEGDQEKIINININRDETTFIAGGNSLYYQWGRKDPFQSSDGSINCITKRWYTKDGSFSTSDPATAGDFGVGADCIKNYIQRPDVYNLFAHGDFLYSNLWSANNNSYSSNSTTVVKTIYDPSPVGYCMPLGAAFTGFTTTGGNNSTLSEINGRRDISNINRGWHFNANDGKTIFFKTLGSRFPTGKLGSIMVSGLWYRAEPGSLRHGRIFCVRWNSVLPQSNISSRLAALPIRPVREQ